jgi:hypothetical protein
MVSESSLNLEDLKMMMTMAMTPFPISDVLPNGFAKGE